jgi:hypothetical protein
MGKRWGDRCSCQINRVSVPQPSSKALGGVLYTQGFIQGCPLDAQASLQTKNRLLSDKSMSWPEAVPNKIKSALIYWKYLPIFFHNQA